MATFPHRTLASPPTHRKTAKLPISSSLAFPPLGNAIPRLAGTHAPFTAPLPISVPANCASAGRVSYHTAPPTKDSVAYGVRADFVLMNMASPSSDRITSHGAHVDSENPIWRHCRHSFHKNIFHIQLYEVQSRNLSRHYVCGLRGNKYTIIHIMYMGTNYSDTEIVSERSCEIMAKTIGAYCILQHDTSKTFSADCKFTKRPFLELLASHNIVTAKRPVRQYFKTGIVQCKQRTIERILEKIQFKITSVTDNLLLAKAAFLSYIFSDSPIVSSFELVRGYTPAIVGKPTLITSAEIIEWCNIQQYTRSNPRMHKSRQP